MGREANCQCNWAGTTANVKALLETSELILRGEMRKRIPFVAMTNIEAHAGHLAFDVAGGRVELFLEKGQAAKWAAAIQAGPVPLAKKLGIAPESVVRTIGAIDDESLKEALAQAAKISPGDPTLIVACVETPADLDSALKAAAAQTAKGVPIWFVYPKGPGHALNESLVRSSGLATGIVDTKVAAVSARLTAMRFNRRRTA